MRRRSLLSLLAVAALQSGCANLDDAASPQAVLSLTASPQAIAANGFSTVSLVATLDPRTAAQYRDVTFTTTLGSFVGTPATSSRTLTVPADADGRAVATLRAGTEPGTAVVSAEVRQGEVPRAVSTVNVRFEQATAADLILLELEAITAPADGATVTNVLARIDARFLPTQQTVTFTTTAGLFAPTNSSSADVRAGADSTARVGLVSPREPVVAIVSAIAAGFTARQTVTFAIAEPDSMTLGVLGSFRVQASFASKISLRAQLFRTTGTATRGQEVRFSITDDSTGRSFGFFSAITPSDASGIATAEFTPGNTGERGEATIEAYVADTHVAARVTIEIIDPPP
jgi:hypothetical protein